jgi:hypothetical protein
MYLLPAAAVVSMQRSISQLNTLLRGAGWSRACQRIARHLLLLLNVMTGRQPCWLLLLPLIMLLLLPLLLLLRSQVP